MYYSFRDTLTSGIPQFGLFCGRALAPTVYFYVLHINLLISFFWLTV